MILHGENLIIKADGVAIAAAKSCTVRVSASTISVSDPDDGQWEHSIPGRKSWSCSTGHLVVNPKTCALMVGTSVQMKIVIGSDGNPLPFSGFVNDTFIIIYPDPAPQDAVAIFYTPTNSFLFKSGGVYYTKSDFLPGYKNLQIGDVFTDTTTTYQYYWNGSTLVEQLSPLYGNAIVHQYEVTAAVGSLAKGSFSFIGTGPLK